MASSYGRAVLVPDPLVRDLAAQYLHGLPSLPHLRYDPDQPRDEAGRFGEGGGGGGGRFGEQLADAQSGQDALDAAMAGTHRDDTGLTEVQAQSFEKYRSFFGYREINGQLRSDGKLDAKTAEDVRNLDNAMKSSPLSDDVVVYRGIRDGEVLFGEHLGEDLADAEWTEPAFLSTTASENVAENWSRHGLGRDDDPSNPVVMQILAPSGTGAVQMSGLEFVSGGPGASAELLLERGLGLRVVDDHGVIDGARRLDVEVVR